MRQQMEKRLQELKAEFDSGQKMMADLETNKANLSNTLLRISGAIQVLEEELTKEKEAPDNGDRQRDKTEVAVSVSD